MLDGVDAGELLAAEFTSERGNAFAKDCRGAFQAELLRQGLTGGEGLEAGAGDGCIPAFEDDEHSAHRT